MKPTLFLEDLFIGQKFVSDEYPVEKDEIIAFASKYDPQVFHTDPEKAKNTFFGGHAASGWHTASISMRLIMTSVPLDCGIIGLGGEITWLKPVRPGNVLHVESEILNIEHSATKPDRGFVSLLSTTKNRNGDTMQTFNAKILVFRKKPPI